MPSNCGTDSHCKLPVLTPLQPSVGDVEDKQGVGHSVTSVHLVFFSWGGGGWIETLSNRPPYCFIFSRPSYVRATYSIIPLIRDASAENKKRGRTEGKGQDKEKEEKKVFNCG